MNASVGRARQETRTALGGLGSARTSGRAVTENDEDFTECFSGDGSQPSPGEPLRDSPSEHPSEHKVDKGDYIAHESMKARSGVRGEPWIEKLAGNGEASGVAASRHKKTEVELAAAVEKSRASERRWGNS